jgi:ABC-type antimicrobial peptide transport system permease subunit
MLAIGAGAQKAIMDRFTAFGTNLLTVRPAQRGTGGVMSGTHQNLTPEDALALTQVPGVAAVSPAAGGRAQVKYLSKNTRTDINGVTVLGPVTAEDLFGAEDPIDKTVKINGINFRVIGVLKSKGDQGFWNPDDEAFVPYTTAMKQLFGLDYLREITCRVKDGADIDKTQNAILDVMRKRHRVLPGQPDDVQIRNQAEFLSAATEATNTFTYLLGSVAAISLLVGGIGIMNIMLVSVTERTREIGIRKAIGAKDRDILRQFLIEAILMSGIGGLLGVALGVGVARLVPLLTHGTFQTLVQVPGILLAIGFSAAVGIFFGYYPAVRAARLDPIDALRYE